MIDAGYINSLAEPGLSRAYGAYADGHHDGATFAQIVAKEYERTVAAADVRRGYYRVLRGVMHFTMRKGRGATAATWVEWR